MKLNNCHLVYWSASLGLLTIFMGVSIVLMYPIDAVLPEGYRTPMIAFEFAKLPSDLLYLSGSGLQEQSNRDNMTAFLHWDMAFLLAYTSFILLLFARAITVTKPLAMLGILFTLLIIPLDMRENLTLLDVTRSLASEDSRLPWLLLQLHSHTWHKWWVICAALLLLSAAFMVKKERWSAMLSGLSAISIAICWVSGTTPFFAEMMGATLLLFFLYFAIKECWHACCVIRSA